MNEKHIKFLVCPKTHESLRLTAAIHGDNGVLESGKLCAVESGYEYPIVSGIPRFVPSENYAESFGFQWTTHNNTQYDEESGQSISKDRFLHETKWAGDLSGQTVLEAGCGSGRFTPHALETGAVVVSLDYSNAVEANYDRNGNDDKLLIVQADILQMPFLPDMFDKIYCFGVLQHTPDPKRAFQQLVRVLKPGGRLASDVYRKVWHYKFHALTWFRPFAKGRDPEDLYAWTKKYVDLFWPLSNYFRKGRIRQKIFSRFVADRSDQLSGADDSTLREWAYLDTFDWFAPAYHLPQSLKTFRQWHEEAKLDEIEVHYGYNGIEGRGKKPKI